MHAVNTCTECTGTHAGTHGVCIRMRSTVLPFPLSASYGRRYVRVRYTRAMHVSSLIVAVNAVALNCQSSKHAEHMQSEWKSNQDVIDVLDVLEPIYLKYKDTGLTFADLIVFAGTKAVEAAGGGEMSFCPGRVDAQNGETDTDLSPRTYYLDPLVALVDSATVRIVTCGMRHARSV
jgi:hypothetical protein